MVSGILNVLGFVATVVGTVLTVLSIKKVQTAREARRRVEERFKRYTAAQHFENLTANGLALMQHVTTGDWQSASAAANRIGSDLLKARGA